MNKARAICTKNGVRFTKKRQEIFETLVGLSAPVSAYELADAYRNNHGEAIAAMSVYRILDFLMEQHLVHKLSSTNKFIPCAHIACEHSHGTAQFLICDQCQAVKEITLKPDIVQELKKTAEQAGFELQGDQLELNARCELCR